MYSNQKVRKAIEIAAALMIIDHHADNTELVDSLSRFILAADQYRKEQTPENEALMVSLGGLDIIREINYGFHLLE